MGEAQRRERAEETCNSASGYAFKAHPWQSSQTLSLASHEMLLMLCWRYCLDTPGGLQPPRICFGTCSHVGTPTPALRDTLERADLAALTQREWLVHAVRSCVKSGGVRRLCHDAVLRVLFDMLKSASFERADRGPLVGRGRRGDEGHEAS